MQTKRSCSANCGSGPGLHQVCCVPTSNNRAYTPFWMGRQRVHVVSEHKFMFLFMLDKAHVCCQSIQQRSPWAPACLLSPQRMDAANSTAQKGENHRGHHVGVLSQLRFTSLDWRNRYGGVCPFISRLCECYGRRAALHPAAVQADRGTGPSPSLMFTLDLHEGINKSVLML